jgi:hypothetical protein
MDNARGYLPSGSQGHDDFFAAPLSLELCEVALSCRTTEFLVRRSGVERPVLMVRR